jgi:hypothetical protein
MLLQNLNGVLGHYCIFDATNDETTEVNLFAVESEIMKSYPGVNFIFYYMKFEN